MWTLWLVSEVLQRLSVRNQSSEHSSAAPRISGMKHKYSAARERRTGEMQGGGYRAVTFFPWHFRKHVTLSLPLSLPRSLTQIHTDNQQWKYFSNVKRPQVTEAALFSPCGRRIALEERSNLPAPLTDLPETHWLPLSCEASHAAQIQSYNPGGLQQRLSPSADTPLHPPPDPRTPAMRHKCLLCS